MARKCGPEGVWASVRHRAAYQMACAKVSSISCKEGRVRGVGGVRGERRTKQACLVSAVDLALVT